MTEKTFSFNWRASPAHIWFLTTFLRPRQPDDYFNDVDWRRALGGPPEEVITIFQVQGVLTQAPLPLLLEAKCTRDELRALCRERELPVSGTKGVLIQRLVAADRAGMLTVVNTDV